MEAWHELLHVPTAPCLRVIGPGDYDADNKNTTESYPEKPCDDDDTIARNGIGRASLDIIAHPSQPHQALYSSARGHINSSMCLSGMWNRIQYWSPHFLGVTMDGNDPAIAAYTATEARRR